MEEIMGKNDGGFTMEATFFFVVNLFKESNMVDNKLFWKMGK